MTTPVTKFISKEEYDLMKDLIGTLMFPNYFWDISEYVDKKKLQKKMKSKKTIKKVICLTANHQDFKPIQNKDIDYESPLCVSSDWEGAYKGKYGISVSNHPYGNVFLVI